VSASGERIHFAKQRSWSSSRPDQDRCQKHQHQHTRPPPTSHLTSASLGTQPSPSAACTYSSASRPQRVPVPLSPASPPPSPSASICRLVRLDVTPREPARLSRRSHPSSTPQRRGFCALVFGNQTGWERRRRHARERRHASGGPTKVA
jgi:hypothetical protein